MDLAHDVVMGHEFAAEVVELGPDVGNSQVGDIVVSMPITFDAGGIHSVGYSNHYPGRLRRADGAERPARAQGAQRPRRPTRRAHRADGRRAARRQPLAVTPGHAAVVLGRRSGRAGGDRRPARRGVEPIVAADFSETRRALATTMGAHEVVDPSVEPAIDAWRRLGAKSPLVIFEAVGVPGMLDAAMATRRAGSARRRRLHAARHGPAHARPSARSSTSSSCSATTRSSSPRPCAASARASSTSTPLITGSVGIDGIPGAFEDLGRPDAHAKILVEPS